MSAFYVPSVEREVSGQLGDYADDHAIQVFAANLRNLLLQPPLKERGGDGHRPWFPHRLQGGDGGFHRQAATYGYDLPP